MAEIINIDVNSHPNTDNDNVDAKIEQFLALKAQIAELTKAQDAIKAELSDLAKTYDNDKLATDNHSVSVTVCQNTTIDKKALMEAHPKLAAKFLKVTSYERVNIK